MLRLSATWHVRQFLLFRDLDEPDLWLGTDGAGRWGEMNGAHRPDLAGCTDIDLAVTPFTSVAPDPAAGAAVGDDAEVTAAMVDVETLGVVPVEHRVRTTDRPPIPPNGRSTRRRDLRVRRRRVRPRPRLPDDSAASDTCPAHPVFSGRRPRATGRQRWTVPEEVAQVRPDLGFGQARVRSTP